ncbi:Zn(2)-C6 fungal-type domain-containing protein [Fusarium sp. Ph1]|nr:Zn(2)-C6 fungal-type domain-containing protein [Fusarium sp. Ph1]
MSTQGRMPPRITRSRGGCERCRRRRQKCDQKKPSCERCVQAGIGGSCRYELKLSWGGRSFRKSPFGKYLDNVERDNAVDGHGFVYCVPQSRPAQQPHSFEPPASSPLSVACAYNEPIQPESLLNLETAQTIDDETELIIPHSDPLEIDPELETVEDNLTLALPPPSQISVLPPMAHYLFQFYLAETMRLTVPSSYARTQICHFLVPMSMQQPSLLYAIMAFAAVHLEASGRLPRNPGRLIDTLQSTSIRHLRQLLTDEDPIAQAAALATARTLCQAQIYGGTASWRVHLNGARAILESSHFRTRLIGSCSCSSINADFLSSWFNNAEALAALSPSGLLHGQLQVGCHSSRDLRFDMFGGVMSDLPDLFREVGALVKESRRQQHNRISESTILSETDIAQEADALTREIYYRLERDSVENLALQPDMLMGLSANDIHDYALSNAGFLYTALLHIHCGVRALSPYADEAQFCVDQIIQCAQDMTCSSGLSPRVLLVAPLFTAGICATGPAQDSIRSALTDIGRWMRTPHLAKTQELLEEIWLQPPAEPQSSRVWSWFDKINFDFLPY